MKARYIKKLRKRIATFDEYQIRKSAGLFGVLFGNNRLRLVMDNYYIMADSPQLALKMFFRYYERMFHRRHDIMVKNLKSGFRYFYK